MDKCPKCDEYSVYYDRILRGRICENLVCDFRDPEPVFYSLDLLIIDEEDKEKTRVRRAEAR